MKNFNYYRWLHEFKSSISKYKIDYLKYQEQLFDVFHNTILESLEKEVPDFYFNSIMNFRIKDFIKKISSFDKEEETFDLFDSDESYEFKYPIWKDINISLQKVLEDKDYILLRNKLDLYSNKELAKISWISEKWIEKRFTKIFSIIKENKELFEWLF